MNPLKDLLSETARRVIYAIVFLALLAFGAWQASEGNVQEAVFSFLTSLAPLLAANNVPHTDHRRDDGKLDVTNFSEERLVEYINDPGIKYHLANQGYVVAPTGTAVDVGNQTLDDSGDAHWYPR